MGADGDVSNCAWYRTIVNAPFSGAYTIFLGSVADVMNPFVDGTSVPAANVSSNSFTANLSAGSHTVAIFTAHYGRNKLVGYNGPISQMYVKGLSGTAYLFGIPVSGPTSLTNWKIMGSVAQFVGNSNLIFGLGKFADGFGAVSGMRPQRGASYGSKATPPLA
jgi:hypothetical protein